MARHQRHQRLGLAAGHQRQEGLIAHHQGETLQQRLQGSPAPELARGVMGVADPQHLGRWGGRKGLGEGRAPVQGQGVGPMGGVPAGEGAGVVGEARLRQQAHPCGRGVPRRPGEQLGGPIAWQHLAGLEAMAPGQKPPQDGPAPIGIGAQRGREHGRQQGPPQGPGRAEGHQRSTGIEEASGRAAEARRRRGQIASMTLGRIHPHHG